MFQSVFGTAGWCGDDQELDPHSFVVEQDPKSLPGVEMLLCDPKPPCVSGRGRGRV